MGGTFIFLELSGPRRAPAVGHAHGSKRDRASLWIEPPPGAGPHVAQSRGRRCRGCWSDDAPPEQQRDGHDGHIIRSVGRGRPGSRAYCDARRERRHGLDSLKALSFDVSWASPLLLLAGYVAFKRRGDRLYRDLGRVGTGLGSCSWRSISSSQPSDPSASYLF